MEMKDGDENGIRREWEKMGFLGRKGGWGNSQG
jgi:hypothetical protein